MKIRLRCLAFAGLMLPVAVLGNVVFPTNPQTRAECDGPAAQLRAMSRAEDNAANALMREENKLQLTRECSSDNYCWKNYYAQHHEYYLKISAHFRERDRLTNLRYMLERKCRRIARANEKVAEATVKAEQERQQNLLQRARAAYRRMKQNYERIRALGKNLTETDRLSLKADMQQADDSMVDLNDAMDDAKRLILDPVPNHPIVRGFQDSAYKKFKQQMQDTRLAANNLENMISHFQLDSAPTQEAQEDDSPFMRRSGGSATNMFRGDPGGKQAAANAAEKKRVIASINNQNQVLEQSADALRPAVGESGDARTAVNAIDAITGKTGSSNVTGASGTAGDDPGDLVPKPGAGGKDIAVCKRELNSLPYADRYNAMTRDSSTDTVLLMRATIKLLRDEIRIANQCLPDPQAQQSINSWSTTLKRTYRTCRQVSTSNNCLVSPF